METCSCGLRVFTQAQCEAWEKAKVALEWIKKRDVHMVGRTTVLPGPFASQAIEALAAIEAAEKEVK